MTKRNSTRNISQASTTEEYLARVKKVHGDKFTYERLVYVNARTKVIVTCRIHGDFYVLPQSHRRGSGCGACVGTRRLNTTKFIARAREVHGDKYDYTLVEYINNSTSVTVVCKEHGEFYPTPNNHLKGTRCPKCANSLVGWNKRHFAGYCKDNNNGLGRLYVIKCTQGTERFYKIGITSRPMHVRFGSMEKLPYNYSEVFLIEGDPDYIYNLERRLHAALKDNKYSPKLKFGGMTECFETIKPVERLLKKLTTTEQLQLLA